MKKTRSKNPGARQKADYDSAWKDVLEELFEPFVKLFFPQAHSMIDFSKKCEFLGNTELRQIAPDSKTGKRYPDGVVELYLKDGTEKCICIYIHIEVQGEKEDDFPERMYVYNYRIYDYYREKGIEVISFAILTDEDENYRPNEYKVSRFGFELRMKYPLIKIIDYKVKNELKEKLETSDNPVAMVIRSVLKSYDVKRDDAEKRYYVKLDLIRQCYQRGYGGEQVKTLLKFIDWVIRLPERYHKKFSSEIIKLEEEHKMPYVTSWERIAKREGKREGKVEGKEEEKREVALKMLQDGMSIEKIASYTGLTEKEVKELLH
jgi:hypothetical protein